MNSERYVLKSSTTKAVLGSKFTLTLSPAGNVKKPNDVKDENSNLETGIVKRNDKDPKKNGDTDAKFNEKFFALFKGVAGDDQEVDAFELQDVIGRIFKRDFGDVKEFSLESCRSMIVMADDDRSGKLTFEQFQSLFQWLMKLRNIYHEYENTQSWDMNVDDMKEAVLVRLGYEIRQETLDMVAKRFYNRKKKLNFDDFLQICCRLCSCSDRYAEYQTVGDSFDEFCMHMIYT